MKKPYHKHWDNFNYKLYKEYINSKNQQLEDLLTDISIDSIKKMLENKNIILYNDDVNTFDNVMKCLIAFCGHTSVQAEQCALIADNKGKCSIKSGTLKELEPIASVLLEFGLTVEIE